eukprot:TRINITY_DN9431_c1_g2_i1.p1 TRINITY_DN9431_c1_g2~~TRINITY_DN9431_c1_g2_i1.p1  ORF type:complete len:438 (-),score=81.55 TRINITY_DN9431_c1_g2_i1:166-1359(-)
MEAACGLRRVVLQLARRNRLGLVGPWSASSRARAFASTPSSESGANSLIGEVEFVLATGSKAESSHFNRLDDLSSSLRQSNDEALRELDALKSRRTDKRSEMLEVLDELRSSSDVSASKEALLEGLSEIAADCSSSVGLLSEHLTNSKALGELKRARVVLDTHEDVLTIIETAEEALTSGEKQFVKDALENVAELIRILRTGFDDRAMDLAEARGDLQQSESSTRNVDIALRQYRTTLGPHTFGLRSGLVAHLLEAQRKSVKMTRIRDLQVTYVKEITALTQLRERLYRRQEVSEVLATGDKAKLADEAARITTSIETGKAESEALLAREAELAETFEAVRQELRALKDAVTPTSGNLREQLIAAIREDEWCVDRLASLAKSQALNVRLLQEVRAAI